jgi:hypothetical protein
MSSSSWIAPAKPSESDAKAIRQSSRNARYSGWNFGDNISLYFLLIQKSSSFEKGLTLVLEHCIFGYNTLSWYFL